MTKLVLETKCCVGYGYMSYIHMEADRKIVDFLNNFCMWGGSTKTYDNYKMYELPEEIMNFMQTESFKSFLARNGATLITNNEREYQTILQEIFER